MNKKVVIGSIAGVAIIIVSLFLILFLNNEDGDKEYSTNDFTFISSEKLTKKKLEKYDYYFENENSSVVILGVKEEKEELAKLEGYENLTLESYAKVIYEGEEDTTSELKYNEKANYYYFSYNYTGGSEDIFYIATMYETEEAFYIINFASELKKKNDYEKEFIKWADSLKFKDK